MIALILVFAASCGGAFGSFVGVAAARGWSASLTGRSRCESCGRVLRWYELVPLVSFLALRARCRTCAAQIGWRTYLWELGGGIVAVLIALTVLLITRRAAG